MRSGRERKLGPAVKDLTESLAPKTPLAAIERAWPKVVGEALASHSEPASLRAGRLSVKCSGSVYSQELEMLSATVLEALSREVPEAAVEAVSFSVGRAR